jgi:hypothetical protein
MVFTKTNSATQLTRGLAQYPSFIRQTFTTSSNGKDTLKRLYIPLSEQVSQVSVHAIREQVFN